MRAVGFLGRILLLSYLLVLIITLLLDSIVSSVIVAISSRRDSASNRHFSPLSTPAIRYLFALLLAFVREKVLHCSFSVCSCCLDHSWYQYTWLISVKRQFSPRSVAIVVFYGRSLVDFMCVVKTVLHQYRNYQFLHAQKSAMLTDTLPPNRMTAECF